MKKVLIAVSVALIAPLIVALGGRAYAEHNKGQNFAYDCGIDTNEVETVKEEK